MILADKMKYDKDVILIHSWPNCILESRDNIRFGHI